MFLISKISGSGWLGKHCSGFVKGFFCGLANQMVANFTNTEITIADDLVRRLEHCPPCPDHITAQGMVKMERAIKAGNGEKTRQVITSSGTADTDELCIDALLTTVTILASAAPNIFCPWKLCLNEKRRNQ